MNVKRSLLFTFLSFMLVVCCQRAAAQAPVRIPPGVQPPNRPTPQAPNRTPDAAGQEGSGIFKFVLLKQVSSSSGPYMCLTASPALGGLTLELFVENTDPAAHKLDPVAAVMDVIKDGKAGDMFDIQYTRTRGRNMISSAKAYEMRPGESEMNVYVFTGKGTLTVGKEEHQTINVTKFAKPGTFVIPNKRNADGTMSADDQIAKVANVLKENDAVEVLAERVGANQMIRHIRAYGTPKQMEFVKAVRPVPESGPAGGATSHPAGSAGVKVGAELKDGSAELTLMVNPKSFDSLAVTNRLNALKPGQAVLVRSAADDDGQQWLVDIRVAPPGWKPPTSKPASEAGSDAQSQQIPQGAPPPLRSLPPPPVRLPGGAGQ